MFYDSKNVYKSFEWILFAAASILFFISNAKVRSAPVNLSTSIRTGRYLTDRRVSAASHDSARSGMVMVHGGFFIYLFLPKLYLTKWTVYKTKQLITSTYTLHI